MFKEKTLLITGGTGSFGKMVLKRFLKEPDIREIRIFSRDEKKQFDLRNKLNDSRIKFYIGDVRDQHSVDNAVRNVDFIFHAAALKQVPSCEFFPIEAVKTNILGTENLLAAAEKNLVKKVIVLSTDKAVYPVNAMGLSKALMEKTMIARSRNLNGTDTVFCGTRYGNVMASRGSVIPLFIEQIKNKQPITVTDPEMTRFLMTLDDSVDLVLYAFKNGNNGDIFVQKAPASSIGDLARALKELFNSSSPIKIIGTRHGEKLYETLCTREEIAKAEDLGEFLRIPADNRELNYGKYFYNGDMKTSAAEDYHSHNTKLLSVPEIIDKCKNNDFIKRELKDKEN